MRICLAPMDGITDCAYRVICKEVFELYGNKHDELMLWTEFMSADGYAHNPPGVIKHLLKTEYDHETIAQIFGGNADTLIACAQDIEKKYDFAGIELNMGCPSPKIMKCAAGSGMLKDKKQTLNILQEISSSISTPFSLKTRTGLTKDDVEEQFEFLLEASKYVRMIAVHGRTYKQSHAGFVDWDFLYRLKEALPDKVIIGNGGLRNYQQCLDQQHNLDGMMIAQSAIGNPWVLVPHQPSVEERLVIIIKHLDLAVAADIYFKQTVASYHDVGKLTMPSYAQLQDIVATLPEEMKKDNAYSHAVIEFRKYLFNYISGLPNSKPLKQQIIKIRDYLELRALLENYFTEVVQYRT